MLSLLSLIIASGSVLKTDTSRWDPYTYPDPRVNTTECKTEAISTLCDPDYVLSDTWRSNILKTLNKYEQLFQEAEIPYADEVKEVCQSNISETAQIYFVLARQIQTASNHSLTSDDTVKFGDGLRDAYGLESQTCKNYVLIVSVDFKETYVRTGSALALKHQVDAALEKFKNVFTGSNYIEVDNFVTEIGELVMNPLKDATTTELPTETSTEEASTTSTTPIPAPERVIPSYIYVIIAVLVLAVVAISGIALWYIRRGMSHNIHPMSDSKIMPYPDPEGSRQYASNIQHRSMTIITNDERDKDESASSHNNSPSCPSDRPENRSFTSRLSTRRNSVPIAQAAYNIINKTADTVLLRSSGYFSSTESAATSVDEEKKHDSKVSISPAELSTDVVLARRHSETIPHPARITDQFSSF